jgi:methionyl aminopeptidase
MIHIKNSKEIELMRKSGKILAIILEKLQKEIKVGVKTKSLDIMAQELIKRYGARPAFLGFGGYPYSTCISINEEIVHGLPSERVIKEGDIVSVDCGVNYKGYNSDAAFTVAVGKVNPQLQKLIKTTKEVLDLAISLIKDEVSLKSIQKKMQGYAQNASFRIIREYTGHGIGKKLQEEPSIANYVDESQDIILKKGMTICIEPMLSCGDWRTSGHDNGWTVQTADMSISAHFEHTLLVTEKGCQILTTLDEKK